MPALSGMTREKVSLGRSGDPATSMGVALSMLTLNASPRGVCTPERLYPSRVTWTVDFSMVDETTRIAAGDGWDPLMLIQFEPDPEIQAMAQNKEMNNCFMSRN